MERQWCSEAEAAFAEAVGARPDVPSVWVERGRFYAARSQPEKAAADFVQGMALGDRDPEHLAPFFTSDTIFGQAIALRREAASGSGRGAANSSCGSGRSSEAEAVFTKALAAHPDEARFWSARGDLFARQARWPEAAADFTRALELDPSIHNHWYWAALLWLHIGDRSDTAGTAARCCKLFRCDG
jgi:Flp pilus assembly protein TadD